jgi:DNA-binding response OmpR family regulator
MTIASKEFIIVVEDDAALRSEIVLSLQLAGLSALGAADGSAMSELMASHKVDLVVLDLILPGEQGLDIAARLMRESMPVGIIMLTGLGLMQERLQGMHVGADAYLVKPVDPRELIATVLALRRRLSGGARDDKSASPPVKNSVRDLALSASGLRMSCPALGTEIALSDLQRRLILVFKGVKVGQALSREYLMSALGYGRADGDYHRLETLISRFRLKVRSELNEELPLQAIPGQGYALNRAISFQKN